MDNLERIAKELREEGARLTRAANLLDGATKPKAKRVLSIAARKRIAAAQRARWAKYKAKKAA